MSDNENKKDSSAIKEAARRDSGIGEAADHARSVDDILKSIVGSDDPLASYKSKSSHQYGHTNSLTALNERVKDEEEKKNEQPEAKKATGGSVHKIETDVLPIPKKSTVMGQVMGDSGTSELDREALEQMDELIRQQKAGMSLHRFMVTDAYFKTDGIDGLTSHEKELLAAKDSIFVVHVDASRVNMIQKFLDISHKAPHIFGIVGFGPRTIINKKMPDIRQIEQLITSHKKFIGIGEIGLDYHFSTLNKEEQKYLFEMQLRLANRLDVPVYINSKNADADVYAIMNKLRDEGVTPDCVCVPVVRTLEMFQMVLDHGMHMILRPEITYTEESLYRDCVKELPRERLLIASGEEIIPPEKRKGQWNSPRFLDDTIEYCAEEIFNEDKKHFMREISKNFNDLFNSDPEAGDDEFYFRPSVLEPTLIITEAQLLENDIDADGDVLTIKELEEDTLVGNVYFDRESRLVIYTPKRGFIGADKFKYVVTDGRGGQDKATVTIFVAERAEENEAVEDKPLYTEHADSDVTEIED